VSHLDITRQNEPEQLDLLCGEEYFKQRARWIQLARLVAAIVASMVGLWVINTGVNAMVSAVVGLVAAVLVLVGDRWERAFVRFAGSTKDLFDSKVLGIPRSSLNRNPPTAEEIIHRASTLSSRRDHLRDWYPDTRGVAIGYGRLLCQRASVVWDLRLRQRVGGVAMAIAGILAATILVIGCVNNMPLQQFLAAWAAPACALLMFLIQVGWRHLDAVRERSEILALIQRAWDDSVVAGVDVPHAPIASIQDAIFRIRTGGPVVPRVAQRLLDKSFWSEMSLASERLRATAPQPQGSDRLASPSDS
jgi:hypothetical protein